MYKRYYDGYESVLADSPIELCSENENEITTDSIGEISGGGIFSSLYMDDLLLIGVLILMFTQECDDMLLMIILGFVLISGFINA
jgi:hypothetical protein